MSEPKFTVIEHSRNIHQVEIDVDGDPEAWEHWVLLASDRHHDNPKADWDLERKHLEQVAKRGGSWIDVGDVLDLMGGKWDPRHSKGEVREEYAMAPDYLDAVVRGAAEFYAPYTRHLVVMGRGNHEQSILKRHETDCIERLCAHMSQSSGHRAHAGGYGGFVRYSVKFHGTEKSALTLRYFHGAGGGGMMSHGTLATRRMASWTDADVIVCGHTHDHWALRLQREELCHGKGRWWVRLRDQWHIRTPTYKQEWNDGYAGWHVETGKPPKPVGATWMRLSLVQDPQAPDKITPEKIVTRKRWRLTAQFMEAM